MDHATTFIIFLVPPIVAILAAVGAVILARMKPQGESWPGFLMRWFAIIVLAAIAGGIGTCYGMLIHNPP